MRINRLKFKNYRQFKDVEINLDRMQGKKDLHVFVGVMGTGKTNLLNAINWCLYGEEPFLSREDGQQLPLLNMKAVMNADDGAKYRVTVEMNVQATDREITFVRDETVQVSVRGGDSNYDCTSVDRRFKVTTIDEAGNTKIAEGDEAMDMVARFVPYGIKEFFFFDGERLDKYFKEATGQHIRNAIYQISQVDLLDRARDHLTKVITAIQKDAGKLSPEIETTRKALEQAQKDATKNENAIAQCEKQIRIAKEKIHELETNLRGLPEIEEVQSERDSLKQDQKEKEYFVKGAVSTKNSFLFSRGTVMMLSAVIQKAAAVIRDKRAEKKLPPRIDKKVLTNLKGMQEKHRFLRGLISWMGYKQVGVDYKRDSRDAGRTKFSFAKMLKFAIDGISSFSHIPLRLATLLGFAASFTSFVILIWAVCYRLSGKPTPGWASLMAAIVFLGGVQLLAIGIIGEYLGRIYDEVKNRPLYIVDETTGIQLQDKKV